MVDDASIHKVLCNVLESAEYTVRLCSNGQEALAFYEQESIPFRLLVFDAVMPLRRGSAMYEDLLQHDPELPIVFCCGYTQGRLPPEFFDAPRRALVSKPFSARH